LAHTADPSDEHNFWRYCGFFVLEEAVEQRDTPGRLTLNRHYTH
jgi:hypothetical protein